MTRDEAISIAERHAQAMDWPWEGPVYAGREWVWLRCWYRWVVTAPAPNQPGSVIVTVNPWTGAIEDNSITAHVYNWPLRIRNPSFLDFQPSPLWFQFVTAPLTFSLWLLDRTLWATDLLCFWVAELRKPRCPRCRARLRTRTAQQCPKCHLAWHGRPKPTL